MSPAKAKTSTDAPFLSALDVVVAPAGGAAQVTLKKLVPSVKHTSTEWLKLLAPPAQFVVPYAFPSAVTPQVLTATEAELPSYPHPVIPVAIAPVAATLEPCAVAQLRSV